ncbi:MAG: PleD family two-component system response regulator, partial [Pseudomonadales bacterium]
MRILIADDDAVTRQLVQMLLAKWDYDVIPTDNGTDAFSELTQEGGPSLAILDWMMPGLNGPEVCEKVRASKLDRPLYLILLTTLEKKDNIIHGLES